MDPIKSMISGADPMPKDSAPDGEEALRRMLTEPPLFSDSLPRDVTSLLDRRQRRRGRLGGALTLAAVAVAAGVLVAPNLGSITTAPAPAGPNSTVVAPTAAPTGTATPRPGMAPSISPPVPVPSAPVPAASAEWRTFVSADGRISFDHPAEWTVAVAPVPASPASVDVEVSDAEGTVLASLHYGPSGGIGGMCQGPVPYAVLDSVELPLPYNSSASDTITPRFTFRALQEADHVTASYGITSSAAGKGGKSCMFYNVVNGPAEAPLYSFADAFQVNGGAPADSRNRGGVKRFPSMEAARAYMLTLEYLNAKRMITSLKISAG